MSNRRDLILIGVLFAVLLGFVALLPRLRQPSGASANYSSYASDDNGTLALYTWTRQIGYDSQRLEYRPFTLEQSDAALVIVNPSSALTLEDSDQVVEWVKNGGTLIVADDSASLFGASQTLFRELDITRDVYSTTALLEQADPAQPVLDQPPVRAVPVETGYMLRPQTDAYATVLHAGGEPVLLGGQRGAGYVYASTTTYPFTNAGLRDQASAGLLLNLLRRVPAGGRIQFDEYHHGHMSLPSTGGVLIRSPWGWAALYAVVAIGLYLILSGRRFGKPVPHQTALARRSSAEYVESIADLLQRGGKRTYVLRHFHQSFKRRLARQSGVSPRLEDAAFVRELARFRPLDESSTLALLARLRNEHASDAELIRVINDANAMLQQSERTTQ